MRRTPSPNITTSFTPSTSPAYEDTSDGCDAVPCCSYVYVSHSTDNAPAMPIRLPNETNTSAELQPICKPAFEYVIIYCYLHPPQCRSGFHCK
ncbi:unnamed protein product [Dicrocoelium dendriticum]|nr:unnamed protein product [Dicrocoelium dendriticum]